MTATATASSTIETPLLGEAPASPAGPAPDDDRPVSMPPAISEPRALQMLRVSVRQLGYFSRARRELGETFCLRGMFIDDRVVITSHPDHVKSLFTAKPDEAVSTTRESPVLPIVGPNSVLTAIGPRHMRQRKLLLPPFHGDAVERYVAMIGEVAEREIDSWPIGETFSLAPRMQRVTLEVIMSGIFGMEGEPAPGTPAHGLREAISRTTRLSAHPLAQIAELMNAGRAEPVGIVKRLLAMIDRHVYAIIDEHRAGGIEGRTDILSLLMSARDEDGEAMSDLELRNELMTLVLAGHETTANSLSWAFERLLRTPHAYDRLRESVRSDGEDDGYLEATINETMRNRPVVPIIGRRVSVPWQLGDFRLPADTHVLMSIALLHHREDLYPDPFSFRPERFVGVKPGTYTWIPFGGGIRRCLGATLALAELRVVLRAIARRTDMVAPDPRPERVRHRNVTMIPAQGARVKLTARRAA
jgi:cytochrome P450